ncbi:MAG TPA: cytochrome P450, partial [Novosphingobium sp.]
YLRDNPDAIPAAIEEILRRHALSTVARCVNGDTEFGGVSLRDGDRVMLPTMLHGLDEARWDDPLAVKFDRNARDHLTFGNGTHRCPGAMLARAELRIFLEEWLKRIPDFSLAEGSVLSFENGVVTGLKALPLVWPVGKQETA